MRIRKYIPLIAGMLALGAGPATDAVKSASDLFYNRSPPRIERQVEVPSSSGYRVLE